MCSFYVWNQVQLINLWYAFGWFSVLFVSFMFEKWWNQTHVWNFCRIFIQLELAIIQTSNELQRPERTKKHLFGLFSSSYQLIFNGKTCAIWNSLCFEMFLALCLNACCFLSFKWVACFINLTLTDLYFFFFLVEMQRIR